jgi:coproporphyrinogen III oxidase-like Fe-S oxidoreductase
VYLHIPFCRKRCRFCYFKVYTEKDANEIENYLSAANRELSLYSRHRFIGGRKPTFIYFGGGTPSLHLVTPALGLTWPHERAPAPGTKRKKSLSNVSPGRLLRPKLKVIREIGVTRLSLGIENFDDHILEINGRAHRFQGESIAPIDFRAIGRLSTDQYRSHRRHGWRDVGELAGVSCERRLISLPDSVTDLSDGNSLSIQPSLRK